LGKEFTAAERVANSPELEVPARTTFAPAGGLVRAAEAILKRERQKMMQANTGVIFFPTVATRSSFCIHIICVTEVPKHRSQFTVCLAAIAVSRDEYLWAIDGPAA